MDGSGNPAVPQLTPGNPGQMLGEAIRYLKSLPRDPDLRADAFEALASQIEQHSGGAWQAARDKAADGAHVFLGRQAEALVVAPDGGLYRGAVRRGIDLTPAGLIPDYGVLKALD
jgi:hypothetical protein